MIGLKGGNISMAFRNIKDATIPISSLDFDIKNTGENLYEIVLIASKEANNLKYQNIKMSKISISSLPKNIITKLDIINT